MQAFTFLTDSKVVFTSVQLAVCERNYLFFVIIIDWLIIYLLGHVFRINKCQTSTIRNGKHKVVYNSLINKSTCSEHVVNEGGRSEEKTRGKLRLAATGEINQCRWESNESSRTQWTDWTTAAIWWKLSVVMADVCTPLTDFTGNWRIWPCAIR